MPIVIQHEESKKDNNLGNIKTVGNQTWVTSLSLVFLLSVLYRVAPYSLQKYIGVIFFSQMQTLQGQELVSYTVGASVPALKVGSVIFKQ